VPVADPVAKLARLRIEAPTQLPPSLWEAGACSECQHTGYRGRSGMHEFLAVDSSFHPAMVNGVDVPRLEQMARERGFRSMFHDGVIKSLRGVTTLEEVLRVTRQ
jgi:general secretion pathway protein E